MALKTSIVSCSSEGVGSGDMWNLYAGNHPDLHDNYMDPPGQIMIHSDSGRSVSPCSPSKSKEAFNVFYGAQSMSANPLTTSAMVEMQKLCLLSSLAQCDAAKPAPQTVDHNGNVGHANSSCFLKCPQQSTVVRGVGLRLSKSTSISEWSDNSKQHGRRRIKSSSDAAPKPEYSHKTKHKSKSFKTLLLNIIS